MRKKTGILLAFIFIVLVIGYNSLFFVEQRVQALILQFGEPITSGDYMRAVPSFCKLFTDI